MRLVFGRNQRHAEADVHDAAERFAARKTNHRSADEDVSNYQRFDYGRFVEFSSEEKDKEV